VFVGGAYRGKAIDRNLFSFEPKAYDIVVEPPVYSVRQCYTSRKKGPDGKTVVVKSGHYFGAYVPVGDAKHDYLKAEWFKQAMAAEKGYWADPFIDGVDKETPLVPYVVPVRNKQGQTVAILGADLSLYGLSKDMDVVRQGKSNNRGADEILDISFDCFIIDSVGTYIMHGDSARVGRENYFTYAEATPETLDDYVGKQMISGFEGSFFEDRNDSTLMIEGKQVHAYYMPLENTCWSIGLLVPGIIIDIIGYVVGAVLIFFIIIGLLIVLIVGRVSIKRAAKPLKQLATSAGEVAKGRFDTPLPQLKSRDEIHLLRDSFDEMQHSLTRYVEELKSATAQKSALENELRIAHDIQMSMLPKTFPPFPDRSDIDIYGTLTPAKGVGGDLFDFHIRDEKLFFCIGDVSGKGIPAALVMAVTRSLFRNISSYATRPNDIVYALNNALADGNDTNMFVTIFLGVLDLPTGRLLYCNAGHNSPLLVGRKVGELPCDSNLPVGITPNYTFVMQEADIDPQTTIFLFTDGLNEAENNTHAQFGDERIREVAGRVLAKGEQQPLNLIYEMSEAVHRFVNGAEQSDDLTMLAVQYKVSSKEVKSK